MDSDLVFVEYVCDQISATGTRHCRIPAPKPKKAKSAGKSG